MANLNVGDVIYLTGQLVTCRDVAHRRLIELGRELPVDLRAAARFSTQAPSSGRRTMAASRWSPSARPPACAWKSSRSSSSSRPASS
nr:fumarate hydratase C-terminal domain-containing protein [Pseudomonas shirazica]